MLQNVTVSNRHLPISCYKESANELTYQYSSNVFVPCRPESSASRDRSGRGDDVAVQSDRSVARECSAGERGAGIHGDGLQRDDRSLE